MASYCRSTWIDAPLETVWLAHCHIDGLLAVTPDWLGLTVDAVRDEVGATVDPGVELGEGYEIDLSITPLGIGPRQTWTSRIVARDPLPESGEDSPTSGFAMFCDRMIDGPMADWEHTHRFEAVDGGTRMTDSIDYRLPPGRVGAAVSDIAKIGLGPAFWYRHRATNRQFRAGED